MAVRVASSMVLATMAIIGALLAASVPYVGGEDCNFSSSCEDMDYDSGYLTATCKNWKGYRLQTKLYLNNAVKNNDGNLECPRWGGGFLSTCTDISVDGATLTATCTNDDGDSVQSSVNLDNCIKNDNASLYWCGIFSATSDII
ncbi:hypothetical protein GOP47_0021838 [Adiantum capillus-veneris]|uniref:Cyanovirin-N domain-containing protein n=1 Tax=Adiantum capillus-veneris TaxID=13818 RepID=A0A9D4U867_ADICA|nr:hypothetical protein GOP47_0021838 [Adiantum capillus-veneris]